MARRRRGKGNGSAAVEARRVSESRNLGLAVKDSPWVSWAYGATHESYVRPPKIGRAYKAEFYGINDHTYITTT